MKSPPKNEIKRKIFHSIYGLCLVLLVMFFGDLGVLLLLAFLAWCLVMSLTYKRLNLKFVRFFIEKFERDDAKKKFPGKGGIIFLCTALLVLVTFERDIAFASIMILALGDTVSNLFGRMFGRTPSPFDKNKMMEGTVAGIIAATAGAWIFVPVHHAFIASVISMIVENFDWGKPYLDDNFTVPMSAAVVLTIFGAFI